MTSARENTQTPSRDALASLLDRRFALRLVRLDSGDIAVGRRGDPLVLVDEPTGWVACFCTEYVSELVRAE